VTFKPSPLPEPVPLDDQPRRVPARRTGILIATERRVDPLDLRESYSEPSLLFDKAGNVAQGMTDIIIVNDAEGCWGADRAELIAEMARLGWENRGDHWSVPKSADPVAAYSQLCRAVEPIPGMTRDDWAELVQHANPDLHHDRRMMWRASPRLQTTDQPRVWTLAPALETTQTARDPRSM
jgi:hypothetical protein